MKEFATIFKQFFYRDIMFVFGGFVFLSSLIYSIFGNKIFLLLKINNMFISIVTIVLCYILGYLLQEICTLFHIINLNPYFEPSCYARFLFRCFTRDDWKKAGIKKFDPIRTIIFIDENINKTTMGRFERIVSLKQICNVCGSSFLFSFIPLLIAFRSKYIGIEIPILFFFLALFFIHIAWIKGMQQMQWMATLTNNLSKESSDN